MEVAVGLFTLTSWSKNIVRLAVLSALTGTVALTVGCGNLTGGSLLTYAGEARDQGIRQYNAGEFAEAAGSFQNAIRQRPQDWESYYYLGRTYEAMKNYHQAVSQYVIARNALSQTLSGKNDSVSKYKILEGLGIKHDGKLPKWSDFAPKTEVEEPAKKAAKKAGKKGGK